MSESKHTPGPWAANSISMEDGDVGVSAPELRISICHVHNAASFGDMLAGAIRRGDGRFQSSDCATQFANARLIAAAPDYDDAAGLAITALAFAAEGYQRSGDQLALAQTLQAKTALIAAQNKARGRDNIKMRDVTPTPAAIAKATGSAS